MNRLEALEIDVREIKRMLNAIEQHLERVGITDDAVFTYPPKPRDIDYKIDLLAQHFELYFETEPPRSEKIVLKEGKMIIPRDVGIPE